MKNYYKYFDQDIKLVAEDILVEDYDFAEGNRVFSEEYQKRKEALLEDMRKREIRKGHLFRRNKWAAPVAVCMVFAIGVTAIAGGFLWNRQVAEQYDVAGNEALQQELIDTGLVDVDRKDIAASDSDIEVSVLLTVANGSTYDIYLMIRGTTEERSKALTSLNPDFEITFDGAEISIINGGYLDDDLEDESADGNDGEHSSETMQGYRIYEISGEVLNDANLEGKEVSIDIHSFVGNTQINPDDVIEGSWELSWNMQTSDEKREIAVDQDIILYGKTVHLDKVVLAPLSVEYVLNRESMDRQNLFGAQVYMKPKAGNSNKETEPGDLLENYEVAFWADGVGLPLEVTKGLSEAERNKIWDQVIDGTYSGEYTDFWEWDENGGLIIEPWDAVQLQMDDGSVFDFVAEGGDVVSAGDQYIYRMMHHKYLAMNHVTAIEIGDCTVDLTGK